MKTVKIIVYILIVLTVVFFGTGLIVKETNYTTEIEIDKSLSETFKLFTDISVAKEWNPAYKSIEIIDKKPGVTGSVYDIVVENKEEKVVLREKILAYVENEKVTLFFDREGVTQTDDYTFKRNGSKTLLTLNSSYQSKSYILGCILPYFKGNFKSLHEVSMNNFKEFIEK